MQTLPCPGAASVFATLLSLHLLHLHGFAEE
jgi:hypothetical protein